MADINYWDLLKKGWKDFRSNLILFIPTLVGIALGIGFLILLAIEFLVFYLIFSMEIINNPRIILSFTGISLAAIFVILNFVVLVLINSYIRSMEIGMFRDIMLYKKTSINNMFAYGKRYVKRYFKINLIRFILYFLPFIFLAGICTLVFLSSKIIGIVLIVLSVFIYIAYSIFLMFFLFFIDPIFVTENKAAIGIIKSSFSYTKNNFLHVFFTWGVSVLTGLIVGIGLSIITLPFSIIGTASSFISGAVVIGMVIRGFGNIIGMVVSMILQLVLGLFQFNSYFSKNKLYRVKNISKI